MTQHGRYQIFTGKDQPGVLYIENISQDKDFWLTLKAEGGNAVVGHLKFKRIGPHTFVLDELRPAQCPILNLQDACRLS